MVGPVPGGARRWPSCRSSALGRYQLGPLLGRGPFRQVFRAQDVKNNLVVALKVLSPEFPADGQRAAEVRPGAKAG